MTRSQNNQKLVVENLESLEWSWGCIDESEPGEIDPSNFELQMLGLWQEVVTGRETLATIQPPSHIPPQGDLASQLHHHLQTATPDSLRACPAIQEILQGCVSGQTLNWFAQRPWQAGSMVLFLAPFWIRPLSQWRPGGNFHHETMSLIQHLFVNQPVPECLYQPWSSMDRPEWRWMFWLLLLGQGADLAQAGALFGWQIPPGFLQHFFQAPATLSPGKACSWAEIARLGGSPLARQVMVKKPVYRWDPTSLEPGGDYVHRQYPSTHRAFWEDTVAWLTRHESRLSEQEALDALTWAILEHTDRLAAPPYFRWDDCSPEQAVASARLLTAWI